MCKKHVKSSKKIDLWKLPNILMIMFKRFKYTETEKKKIQSVLDFDVEKFALNDYVPSHL